jgi:hypothetical protein
MQSLFQLLDSTESDGHFVENGHVYNTLSCMFGSAEENLFGFRNALSLLSPSHGKVKSYQYKYFIWFVRNIT